MSTHRYIDRICCGVLAAILLITILLINGEALGIEIRTSSMGYESRLFDTSTVHSIAVIMEDREAFLETCEDEEYTECTVIIDGETFSTVAIRAKGNTSLSSVQAYGNDRYSFKIEFDHYDSSMTYYGLDKLCLNNLIQDNTYMKDYLAYTLMSGFGVASPLCSYVSLTINGEYQGLYLAVEAVEEPFLERNYGSDYGELYKPDSSSMNGGGSGNDDVKLQYIDDNPDSYSSIFANAKTDITEEDQARLIASLQTLDSNGADTVTDVESVIRYFVVHNFLVNDDSYTGSMVHNYYLYEKDGILSMIPWDYNLSFGGFSGGSDATDAVNTAIDYDLSDRPMVAWIFSSETYTDLYHEYYQEFVSTYFESGYLAELIQSTYELIAPYVEQDSTSFCTYEEFETAVSTLQTFCELRFESIQGQLDGTIPSTDDGQKADSSSLIDGSSIRISDMGSMNAAGGGNFRDSGSFGSPGGSRGSDSTGFPDGGNGDSPFSSSSGADSAKADTGSGASGAAEADSTAAADSGLALVFLSGGTAGSDPAEPAGSEGTAGSPGSAPSDSGTPAAAPSGNSGEPDSHSDDSSGTASGGPDGTDTTGTGTTETGSAGTDTSGSDTLENTADTADSETGSAATEESESALDSNSGTDSAETQENTDESADTAGTESPDPAAGTGHSSSYGRSPDGGDGGSRSGENSAERDGSGDTGTDSAGSDDTDSSTLLLLGGSILLLLGGILFAYCYRR